MAILAGRLANVYASLDAYLQANLLDSTGAPLALRLHGVRRFVPPPVAPWVEAHYDMLGMSSRFLNLAGAQRGGARPQTIGTEHSGLLQLNCYQRARAFSQRYTTAVLRDLVIDAFPEGGVLPILNWDVVAAQGGDLVQEASLIWDGTTDHVQDIGLESGVVQVVISVRTRYWEMMTRA